MNLLLFAIQEDAFQAFYKEGVRPRVWVRTGMRRGQFRIGDVDVFDHSPLKFANVEPVYVPDFPQDLYEKTWREAFPFFVRIINKGERTPKDRARSWADYHHRFHIMLHWYYNLLKKYEIDTIMFDNIPHGGTNIALFFLAKNMGVRTIMGYQTLFPDRFFLLEDFRDLGIFKTSAKTGVKTIININSHPEQPFYMNEHESILGIYMKIAELYAGRAINIIKKHFTGIDKEIPKRRTIYTLLQRLKMIRLQNKISTSVDFSRPYVYFPLHLQPEMTIDVLGDRFADQLSAIEALRKILPEDIYIYVKENPKQTTYAREEGFFKRLSVIPNTVYVNMNIDTYELIRNSLAVATVVGTAGWEALQMRKPVITFGHAWYRCLPGVFRWEQGVTWDEVQAFRYDEDKLQEAIQEMASHFYEGLTMPKGYSSLVENYDPEENGRKVLRAFLHHLEHVPAAGSISSSANTE